MCFFSGNALDLILILFGIRFHSDSALVYNACLHRCATLNRFDLTISYCSAGTDETGNGMPYIDWDFLCMQVSENPKYVTRSHALSF